MLNARNLILMSLVLAGSLPQARGQTPLSTAFTYQGQLKATGMPSISTADFQFSLFDATSGGNQVGATLLKENSAIVNGVFTHSLDFGAAAFSGDARWIEVAVRSPAGSGGFTTLAPRQPITVTPQATYSLNTRGLTVDASGRVGIGIAPPPNNTNKLEVAGSVAVSNGAGFFGRQEGSNSIAYGILPDSSDGIRLFAGGSEKMHLNADGSVGIGETLPSAKLHVRTSSTASVPTLALEGPGRATLQFYPQGTSNILTSGDIGFPPNNDSTLFIRNFDPAAKIAFNGNEGTRYPATGKEDLRIIRGFVIGDGTVDYGSGFTVTRIEEGRYLINFDTPFAEFPVATANTVSVGFSSCFIEFSGIGPASIGLHVVRRSDGDLVDGHFYFIAIGPR